MQLDDDLSHFVLGNPKWTVSRKHIVKLLGKNQFVKYNNVLDLLKPKNKIPK